VPAGCVTAVVVLAAAVVVLVVRDRRWCRELRRERVVHRLMDGCLVRDARAAGCRLGVDAGRDDLTCSCTDPMEGGP